VARTGIEGKPYQQNHGGVEAVRSSLLSSSKYRVPPQNDWLILLRKTHSYDHFLGKYIRVDI
jgi:hypothetical protein